MENKLPVRCSDNEGVAEYLLLKKQEMLDRNALSENLGLTLNNAYRNVANCKTPIKTLKDLSQIKGVGKWILRMMQGFFPSETEEAQVNEAAKKGKKTKEPKRYVPQKNSAAYALLITLYRGTGRGSGFMRKQELIDAAEASGLARTSIAPEKGVGKPGQFSPRDWYTGWTCMKGLISKGLVVRSSCPAKYMLTEEGQEAARECLMRSGMADTIGISSTENGSLQTLSSQNPSNVNFIPVCQNRAYPSASLTHQMESIENAVKPFGRNLQKDQYDISDSDSGSDSDSHSAELEKNCSSSRTCASSGLGSDIQSFKFGNPSFIQDSQISCHASPSSSTLQPCTSIDRPVHIPLDAYHPENGDDALAMPPHRSGEKFEDIYDVILILDDRENFGPRSRKITDIINSQFKIQVEIRRLPIGDGLWIARHRHLSYEYVLDFIVERKRVDDLHFSIRDNRYRDQKLRLMRCGLNKLIYLVEGDPNGCEAAESIKKACFTTEILEGFDVQRTSSLTETVKKYGYLTQAIREYYIQHYLNNKNGNHRVCPSYDDFLKKCEDLEKMTVSDLFALQLMQVPQVTEEIALTVVDLYPTLISLARAYIILVLSPSKEPLEASRTEVQEGDIRAQEELLRRKSTVISASASRNIFKMVWGS